MTTVNLSTFVLFLLTITIGSFLGFCLANLLIEAYHWLDLKIYWWKDSQKKNK